jgi:hypothetical protein
MLDTTRSDRFEMHRALVAAPLSDGIQAVLRAWFQRVEALGDAWMVLRGGETLPLHAGFDLDVLVADSTIAGVLEAGQTVAEELGLKAYVRRKSQRSAKLLFVDLGASQDKRPWLLVDLQTSIALAREDRLRAVDVETRALQQSALQLRVPSSEWKWALAALQVLRKGQVDYDEANALLRAIEAGAATDPFARVLGAGIAPRLAEALREAEPLRQCGLAALGGQIAIRQYKKDDRSAPAGLKARLSRLLFYRLYFVHRHRPPLFAFCGPDGVGKSTVIAAVQTILADYPILVARMHHLVDTKVKSSPDDRAKAAAQPRGLPYRLTRALWRGMLPGWIKAAVIGIQGELRYAYRVNALVGDAFWGGKLCFIDRYAYDRAIKLGFEDRHRLHALAARLNCRLMRRPRLTIVLTDEPARIHARKAELNVERIAEYQASLAELCRKVGAPAAQVAVAGRTPDAIAREIVALIFGALAADLFDLLGQWERQAERESAGRN